MNLKKKSIFIVIILILSILIVNLSINLPAKNLDDEINFTSISISNNHPREKVSEWGQLEIISEPIPNQNNNIGGSISPKIAFENDKIYVVWSDSNNTDSSGTDADIFYRYFNGISWSKIQVISEPIQYKNFNIESDEALDIAVENGNIYVVWHGENNTNNAGSDKDIFFRCNLTGNNWEDIQIISEPAPYQNLNTGYSYYPKIAAENGKIYVVWYDNNNTNNAGEFDPDIFYRCNLTSNNWEDIQVISEPVYNSNFNYGFSYMPEIVVENDKIFVVWSDDNNTNGASTDSDIFFRCNLNNYWEKIQVISEPIYNNNINTGTSYYPSIAIENGKIYVAWGDNNNTNNASTDYDIFYRCNLNGISWEDIQIISEPAPSQNFNTEESSSVSLEVENGKIYMVWTDTNNTNGAGTDSDIFYRCNISGIYWEDIQIISEPVPGDNLNTGNSGSPDITVNYGKNYIVWYDSNETNNAGYDPDIFYRYIFSPVVLGSPSVTPTSGNTSMDFKFTVTYFHLNDIAPTKMIVDIDDIEYQMLEINQADTNYLDGKSYYFDIKNLNVGSHKYQFYASDGNFNKLTALENKPEVYNTQPKITTKNNLTAIEDVHYDMDYKYEDIDLVNVGQTGTWTFSTNAKWLTFESTNAILSGTPTNDDVGEYWVNISIDDSIDSDFTNFTLTVINVNDAPIIITTDTIAVNEDEFYEVKYEALDVDTSQNNLNWFMSTNASWLEFNQESVTLFGLPENDDIGSFWVNISVSDSEYIDFSNFTLKVINVNDPPKIITKEIALAYEDNFYEMDFKAEDIDIVQNDLNWTIITNAQWLNVENKNSIINGTPTNNDVGEYWVNLFVTDGEYTDDRNFTLKVENTNDPPKIIVREIINGKKIVLEIEYARVGELYSRNFEVEDIDPTPQIFSWYIQTNATNWLKLDSITGFLIGEPLDKDIGLYWVNVSVTDGEGGWDYYNYSLNIQKSPTQEKDTSDSSFFTTETFYGLIWIIIIIVILISIIIILTFRKQKKEIIHILEKRQIEMIQTVKAELLSTTPSHISLPAETSTEGKVTLPAQPVVIEQLPPKPADQTQPTTVSKSEEPAITAIGTPPMPQQYQLPKAALSKEQQLNLLRERFLKGEVTEETYNKLRSEIESSPDKDISLTEEEYQNQSADEKQETSDLDEKSTEVEKEE